MYLQRRERERALKLKALELLNVDLKPTALALLVELSKPHETAALRK